MLLKPLIGPNNWRNRGPLNGCPKIPIRYPVSGIPDKRLQWDQCIHKFVMFKGSWLVVWLPSILFSHSYWVALIIPIDELHDFSEGFFPNHQPGIVLKVPRASIRAVACRAQGSLPGSASYMAPELKRQASCTWSTNVCVLRHPLMIFVHELNITKHH